MEHVVRLRCFLVQSWLWVTQRQTGKTTRGDQRVWRTVLCSGCWWTWCVLHAKTSYHPKRELAIGERHGYNRRSWHNTWKTTPQNGGWNVLCWWIPAEATLLTWMCMLASRVPPSVHRLAYESRSCIFSWHRTPSLYGNFYTSPMFFRELAAMTFGARDLYEESWKDRPPGQGLHMAQCGGAGKLSQSHLGSGWTEGRSLWPSCGESMTVEIWLLWREILTAPTDVCVYFCPLWLKMAGLRCASSSTFRPKLHCSVDGS